MKQLTAMIAKMGDLSGAADVANSTQNNNEENNNKEEKMEELRPVVKAIGTNVSDLVEVLCGVSNAPLFLKFGSNDEHQDADGTNDNDKEGSENNGSDNGDNDTKSETAAEDSDEKKLPSSATTTNKTINATQGAGGLATLLLHCSTNLPLQTPSYAALTLGVDVKAPSETHFGFAKRCLELGVRTFGRDLDLALEVCHTTVNNTTSSNSSNNNNSTKGENEYDVSMKSEEEQVAILKSKEDERSPAESSGGAAGNGKQLDAYYRIKLMLRYFAHLANIGIVAIDGEEGSLLVVLEMLVECASRAASTGSSGKDEKSRALLRSSQLLASLVLSTIPYISYQNHRLMELVDALESNVIGSTTSNYVSDYDPASGSKSILLKGELDDAVIEGETMDDDDEEDDDEDEDGGDQPAPCADTLQDLLRTVRKLLLSDTNGTTRFALLDDAPWKALTVDSPEAAEESAAAAAAEGMDVEQSTTTEKVPMSYKGEPLLLDLIGGEEERCKSIPYLLSNDQGEETIEIRCRSLDGIVFGRLSIFDAPPSDDDSDDDNDEEEDKKESNPNMEAYVNTYSLIDRFFLSDAVRDVLLCHRPMVSDAGAERNTAKEVAEQIWSISHLFKSASSPTSSTVAESESMEESTAIPSKVVASKGIEYGIVETLLSLVVQATPTNSSIPSSSPLHSHLYISRVLLELTKLQPTLIPQAIVLATSGLFNDFIPSLTPCARENLGYWFGFHLVNTGYQWPKAYWNHWAPYASTTGGRNSRGEFIKLALTSMASMSSDGAIAVVKDCLPTGSSLVSSVFLSDNNGEEEQDVSSTEKDLIHRMWNTAEDPDTIRQYIIGDELTESASGSGLGKVDSSNSMYHKCVWWRARMAIRALFFPITREKNRIAKATKNASGNEGGMVVEEEVDDSEDILADMSDALPRFKPVVLAALARDADAYDSVASGKLDDDELLLAGEITILKEVGSLIPSWDITMMNAMMECLMKSGIISTMAIAKWALSEHDNDDGSSNGNICNSWWKFVSLAFRNTIRDACSRFEDSKTDVGFGIGMIVDNEGQNDVDPAETAAQRLDEALKSAIPILKYVTDRICQVLAASNAEKKIPLASADVSDGMKCLMRALLFHFNFLVLDDSGVLSISNIQKGLASMDANGEKLGLQCQAGMGSCEGEQSKRLLQSLSLSLEKML